MNVRANSSYSWGRATFLTLVAAVLLSACAGVKPADAADGGGKGSMVLVADQVLKTDGTLAKDLAVVIRDGKIRQVVPVSKVKGQNIRRLGKGTVLCPGLLDLFGAPGAVGQTRETARVVDPEANAAEAIDPRHKDFAAALESGITAAMVAPSPNNLVCGTCVCVRTRVKGGKLDVLRSDGPLLLALGEGVWRNERPPTSRAGALHELRALLASAKAGKAHPRINAVLAGQQQALFVCKSDQDVTAAVDLLGDSLGRFAIVHNDDAIRLADDAKKFNRPIVVGPYRFTTSRRVLMGAGALAKAGVEVAFQGGFPGSPPEGLRISAALAVRHGMTPAAARRAITIVPAKVAGVAGRVGAIAPGKDADLVVFSGDPLRLDSTVAAVYVKGVRVHAATKRKTIAGEQP